MARPPRTLPGWASWEAPPPPRTPQKTTVARTPPLLDQFANLQSLVRVFMNHRASARQLPPSNGTGRGYK